MQGLVIRKIALPQRGVCLGLVVLGLFSLVPQARAQEAAPDTTSRCFDVRALMAAFQWDPGGVDLRLPLEASFIDNMEPDSYDVPLEDRYSLSESNLSELIEKGLAASEAPVRVEALEDSGLLWVESTEEGHRALEALLDKLERWVLRSVELELVVLPASELTQAADCILDPEEAQALLASVTPLKRLRSSTRLGQRALLQSTHTAALVSDYDVEVSNSARIGDPVVTLLVERLELGVVVRELDGGGLFVRAWGREAQPSIPTRTIPIQGFGGAPLQLGALASTVGVASGVVPNGGALLLNLDWDFGHCWMVRVGGVRPRDGIETIEGGFVAAPLLTTPPVLSGPIRVREPGPSNGWWRSYDESFSDLSDDAGEPLMDADELIAILQSSGESPLGSLSVTDLDGSLYIAGPTALRDEISDRVQAWSAALSGVVQVEVRYGLLDPEEAGVFSASSEPDAGHLAALKHQLSGPSRLGDCLVLVRGREQIHLQDYDVEIDASASIADPISASLFDGVSFWCRPTRTPTGRYHAQLDFQLVHLDDEFETIDVCFGAPTESPSGTNLPFPTEFIELPRGARIEVRTAMVLEESEWRLLTNSHVAGTDKTLVAAIRIRPVH